MLAKRPPDFAERLPLFPTAPELTLLRIRQSTPIYARHVSLLPRIDITSSMLHRPVELTDAFFRFFAG